mmetsp:Transcript_14871/g.32354  ORF Transcript_14871/g.32354 Transcript_14871/m.32354 type:complete len:256 (+) Transcript_14871:486-1253(+)
MMRFVVLTNIGRIHIQRISVVGHTVSFVNVSKYVQSRLHTCLDGSHEFNASHPLPSTTHIATSQRRSVSCKDISVRGDKVPLISDIGAMTIEGPIIEVRLPRRSVQLDTSNRNALIFQIGAVLESCSSRRCVIWFPSPSVEEVFPNATITLRLKCKLVITSDTKNATHDAALLQLIKVAANILDHFWLTVVGEIAPMQKNVAPGDGDGPVVAVRVAHTDDAEVSGWIGRTDAGRDGEENLVGLDFLPRKGGIVDG